MYDDIIQEEMENLIHLLTTDKINKNKSNNFLDETNLEDDFNKTQISEMHYKFKKQAEEYLNKYYSGQYLVFCDWCVHVCTVEFHKKATSKYIR
jgi:hypothetical protein